MQSTLIIILNTLWKLTDLILIKLSFCSYLNKLYWFNQLRYVINKFLHDTFILNAKSFL